MIIKIFLLFFSFFFIFLFLYFNNNNYTENFYVTTWTPYIIDYYYQPGFTNYFYNNGYMYPVY
jgi:hypothetical protein